MDTQVKSVSWIGNIQGRFETLYSEIDGIIKQDLQCAENQFLAVGANVKQLYSDFLEEMLPESIINAFQQKIHPSKNEKYVAKACEVVNKEGNGGHANEVSDSNSSCLSFPMGTVGEVHTDSLVSLQANDGKDVCFDQNHDKETVPSSEIPQPEAYYDGEYIPNLAQVVGRSSFTPAKVGEASDPDPADSKAELATVQQLADSFSEEFSEYQLLGNKVSSSGCTLSKELIDINEGHNVEESKDNYVTIADVGVIQPFNTMNIEDSCVIVDGNELHFTSDMLEQHPPPQSTAYNSRSSVKFEKECECRKAASSNDDAQSDQPEGNFLSQPLLTGESQLLDQDFCESDWVII